MTGDHRKSIPVHIQKRLTKLFVSNLPDQCSGNDIAGVVRRHAEIYDIYIARKRDKKGNRFGFVSVLDVKNTGELVKTLSNIRMGDFKLSFNVARFTLEEGEINDRQSERPVPTRITGAAGTFPGMKKLNDSNLVGMRTFKEAMLGRNNEVKEEKILLIQEDFKVNDHGFGKAVIAVMKDFKALKEAGDTIRDLTEGTGVVQYVGGRFIMVSFNSSEEMDRFCLLASEKGEKFQSVEKWIGQTLPFERLAWLRIQGIPLHLLENEVINGIGGKFGKVIKGGQHGIWDSDLSYDYVGVLVSEGKRIQEEVIIQWKGRRYRVWVEEQIGDWEQDFLGIDKGVEVSQTSNGTPQSSENVDLGKQDPLQSAGVLTGDVPTTEMECTKVSPLIKERIEKEQSAILGDSNPSKIMKDSAVFAKDSSMHHGEVDMERIFMEKGSGPAIKNNRKFPKKCGSGRGGPSQAKLISVDNRPTSRKRPRLDVDPNGLDPFGINALLGLSHGQHIESDENTVPRRGEVEGNTDTSEHFLNVSEDRSVEEGREEEVPADILEPDEDSYINNEVPSVLEVENKDIIDEIENTIKLGKVVGANLDGFRNLVASTVEEEGEKRRWVKDLRVKNGVDFLAIQETKITVAEGFDYSLCWGRGAVDCDMVEAVGRSGGIISLWDSKVFRKNTVVQDPNFLLTSGYLVEGGESINVLNVYAPQSVVDKRSLWDKLKSLIGSYQGLWVVLGDFNVVRRAEERKNSYFNHTSASDFKDFIDETELQEYCMRGSKFTFLAARDGKFKLSKIDRVLVCHNFFNKWPRASLRALPRELSDHNPLLLTLVEVNFGYKPFRWFNSWLEREGCREVVLKALNACKVKGRPDWVFSNKLKCVREAVKLWWAEEMKKEGCAMDIYKKDLQNLELIMEDRELEEEEVWVWEECKKGIEQVIQWKCRDMQQKSRVRWASKGDENSAYFHRVMNGRKAANDIPGLNIDGQWITKPNLVKREVVKYFRNHFSEKFVSRPVLVCNNLSVISLEDARLLVRPFSKEEIRKAAFDCGSDRAPGPDGFNFNFIKFFWNDLEDDFFKMFSNFHETGEISRGCSTAFITLIPKTTSPVGLKDYRPITLVGVISKIISKVLSERLKAIMGKIISDTQTAFLKDRFILDGPLVINELYGWIKKTGRKGFLLKIDFEKAYDNVNWEFLLSILDQMGFPSKWCLWVKGILHSARSAILVNGSPTFDFQCQKGVRQGDPISPFLFLIAMEAFSCLIRNACDLGEIKDLRVFGGGFSFSHLLYADDALILGEWSKDNKVKTTRLLRIFYVFGS
ncbi:putative RNA-directed DNA polymerase [Helianthus annuus]|nr:putative RNA-directed DNA polymerase [Helianthus annuus]